MTLTSVASTQAVVEHHLAAFYANNLHGVVADYAPDAALIVPTGVLRGVREITPLFQGLFAEFAKPQGSATFDLQQQVIEGDVAYIGGSPRRPITRISLEPIRSSSATARSWCRPSPSKRHPRPDFREVVRASGCRCGISIRPRGRRPGRQDLYGTQVALLGGRGRRPEPVRR